MKIKESYLIAFFAVSAAVVAPRVIDEGRDIAQGGGNFDPKHPPSAEMRRMAADTDFVIGGLDEVAAAGYSISLIASNIKGRKKSAVKKVKKFES